MPKFFWGCLAIGSIFLIERTEGQSIHKCLVEGKVEFQELPCRDSKPMISDELRQQQFEKNKVEKQQKEIQEAERRRLERLDATPRDKLSPEQRTERDSRELKQKSAERLRRDLEDNDARERRNIDIYCKGETKQLLKIGLSEEQVRYCTSYSSPTSINLTTTSAGVSKQYVFKSFGSSRSEYLYFENGKLVSFQTSSY